MELLNSFEPALHRYEGVGDLLYAEPNGKQPKKDWVAFEARQLHDGQIVCGWMMSGLMNSLDAERLEGVVRDPSGKIELDGLQVTDISMSGGISSGIAYAKQMRLEGSLASEHNATLLEFSVVNLAFSQSTKPTPPLELEADGYSLRFSPSPDYEVVRERLRRMPSVALTAACSCERLDKGDLDPGKAAEIVDSICVALSLATGNKVTWISWRSVADPTLAVSVHRQSVTKRYAGVITAYGWQLDLAKAVMGWLGVKEKDYLKPMVDYFLDAAGQGPYLETRALAAASLLDALTGHYSRQNGFDFLLGESEWKKVRPAIGSALERECKSLGIPSLSANLNALPRRVFREKLKRLLDDHSLPSGWIADLVQIRNELVHSGRFHDTWSNVSQYQLLLWTAFAVLARLTGYRSEIQDPPALLPS